MVAILCIYEPLSSNKMIKEQIKRLNMSNFIRRDVYYIGYTYKWTFLCNDFSLVNNIVYHTKSSKILSNLKFYGSKKRIRFFCHQNCVT